jgi:hypothetical protein
MFYVLQSGIKLGCTFQIEISVLFSNIESHDVPYLSWGLVRGTLSRCIVDRRCMYIVVFVVGQFVKLAALQDAARAPPLAKRATRHVATLTGTYIFFKYTIKSYYTAIELKSVLINAQGQSFSESACNLMIGDFFFYLITFFEELDGPTISALRHAIAEATLVSH